MLISYVILSTFGYVFYHELSEIHILNIFSALCSWLIAPMLFPALCTVYIRYRWLRLVSNEERSLRCCNIMAMVFGGLSALGLSLVANFQVTMKKHFYLLST